MLSSKSDVFFQCKVIDLFWIFCLTFFAKILADPLGMVGLEEKELQTRLVEFY